MASLQALIATWIAAATQADRQECEPQLVTTIWRLAERAAISVGVPDHGSPDVAQMVTDRFVRLLRDGHPMPESPDSYIWRMGENRGRDWHRSQTREAEGRERLERQEIDQPSEWPETIWLERERRSSLIQRVRSLVEEAPANYRRVLTSHYLHNESIEEIVSQYVKEERRNDSGTSTEAEIEDTRRRARQRVDAHISRARQWLRLRLAEDEEH